MNRKPFSKQDYAQNDPKAKALAVQFLEREGLFKLQVPIEKQFEMYKKYDLHILYVPSGEVILIEAQRKHGWTDYGRWQSNFRTIHVEERKRASLAAYLIMFNYHWNTLAIGKMSEIKEGKIIKKNCRCSGNVKTTGEEFFEVFPSIFDFYRLDNGIWRTTTP